MASKRYSNSDGQEKRRKPLGLCDPYKCDFNCADYYTDDQQNVMNQAYWALTSQERKNFLVAFVSRNKEYDESKPQHPSQWKFRYSLKASDSDLPREVCKRMFLNTLGYFDDSQIRRIWSLIGKSTGGSCEESLTLRAPPDRRKDNWKNFGATTKLLCCKYEDCNYQTSGRKFLNSHIKTVHQMERSMELRCDFCDYLAESKKDLTRHKLEHQQHQEQIVVPQEHYITATITGDKDSCQINPEHVTLVGVVSDTGVVEIVTEVSTC